MKSLFLLVSFFSWAVLAETSASKAQTLLQHTELATSYREQKAIGVYTSVLGEPVPSVFSINGAYQISPSLRTSLGVGIVPDRRFDAYTLGSSLKYFFLPEEKFSPYVGGGLSVVYAKIPFFSSFLPVTIPVAHVGGGVEWLSSSGLSLQAGLNLGVTDRVALLPNIGVGWYF